MFNLDDIINQNNKEHDEKWPLIPDHPYRILIIGGYGSGKTNVLLNLIKEQNAIDKVFFVCKKTELTKISVFDWIKWNCRSKTFK